MGFGLWIAEHRRDVATPIIKIGEILTKDLPNSTRGGGLQVVIVYRS